MHHLKHAFENITDWVFDLDNTLYPRHCDLFAQIDWKMTDYVAELLDLPKQEARQLQKQLYRSHGTTLRGLMECYAIDPHDFLQKVHDIDYSSIMPNPTLQQAIRALPGRKHIFTNGDVPHAERTLKRLGLDPYFPDIFDIVAADLEPKPAEGPYIKFLKAHSITPQNAAMFEDMPRNLQVPKKMGMKTILITPAHGSQKSAETWEHEVEDQNSIDFSTDDLDGFLNDVLQQL